MNWSLLVRVVLVYAGVAAGVSATVLFDLAALAGIALPWVAIGLLLGGVVFTAFALGTSDTGIETASAGAAVGFSGGDPMQYQPDALPVGNRVVLAVYCLGLAAWGAAALAVFLR